MTETVERSSLAFWQSITESLRDWSAFAISIVSCCAFTTTSLELQGQERIRVIFEVSLAEEAVPPDSELPELFIAGNHRLLGNWNPRGLALERTERGVYRAEIKLPQGKELEYKITRGSWDLVEQDEHGRDISNRLYRVPILSDDNSVILKSTVARFAEPPAKPDGSSVTGTLVTHENFASRKLSNSRTISVWLPPGYESSEECYCVLYLHDGQNLFNKINAAFSVEWGVDESAQRLVNSKAIEPLIVVGINNTKDRIEEYTVSEDAIMKRGGRGLDTIAFLSKELKPFIDKEYRTKPEAKSTWIGGSSLGALISMYSCIEEPQVFGGCLALSPSLGWDEERLLRDLCSQKIRWPSDVKLWFSMGTKEGRDQDANRENLSRAQRLAECLIPLDHDQDREIVFREFKDGTHSEKDWSIQFAEALAEVFSSRLNK